MRKLRSGAGDNNKHQQPLGVHTQPFQADVAQQPQALGISQKSAPNCACKRCCPEAKLPNNAHQPDEAFVVPLQTGIFRLEALQLILKCNSKHTHQERTIRHASHVTGKQSLLRSASNALRCR